MTDQPTKWPPNLRRGFSDPPITKDTRPPLSIGTLRSRVPSPRERIADYLHGIYGDNPEERHRVDNIMKYVDFFSGPLFDTYDATRALGEGRYADAVLPGVSAAAPMLGKPMKLMGNAMQRRPSIDGITDNLANLSSSPITKREPHKKLDRWVGNNAASEVDLEAQPAMKNLNMLDDIVFKEPKKGEFWARSTPWVTPRRPLTKSPRDFALDYPDGAIADQSGNLLQDVDGRPLTAQYVAGRRKIGGKDERVTPEQIQSVLDGLNVQTKKMPLRALHALGRALIHRETGPEMVYLWDKLPRDQADIVFGHEFGHVLDYLGGNIPTKGLDRELNKLYSELATGQIRPRRRQLPQHEGYTGYGIAREKIAEAIRAYTDGPNTIKTIAPKTAAAIRTLNSHPIISKWIQFNGIPLGATAGTGIAAMGSQNNNAQAKSLSPGKRQSDPHPGLIGSEGMHKIATALRASRTTPLGPMPNALAAVAHTLMSRRRVPSNVTQR